jgi:hypothetical protein
MGLSADSPRAHRKSDYIQFRYPGLCYGIPYSVSRTRLTKQHTADCFNDVILLPDQQSGRWSLRRRGLVNPRSETPL